MRARFVRKLPPNTRIDVDPDELLEFIRASGGQVSFPALEARFKSRGVTLQRLATLRRKNLVSFSNDWRSLEQLVIFAR